LKSTQNRSRAEIVNNFFVVLLGLATFNTEIGGVLASEATIEPSFTDITASTSRETLSNDAPNWTNTHLSIIHQFAARQSLGIDIARVSRFGLRDETLTISAYAPLANKTTLFFEAMKSREHSFLARDSIQAQLQQSFDQGYGAALGVRHARYDATKVTIGEITLEKYFADYRAAVSIYPSHSSSSGNAASYRAAGAYYYGQRSNVQLSISRGTELERSSALLPIVSTDIRSVNIYGRHAFDGGWALDYALGRATRANVTHHEFSAGASFRFK
jgi:YaiO family outer membrane protein